MSSRLEMYKQMKEASIPSSLAVTSKDVAPVKKLTVVTVYPFEMGTEKPRVLPPPPEGYMYDPEMSRAYQEAPKGAYQLIYEEIAEPKPTKLAPKPVVREKTSPYAPITGAEITRIRQYAYEHPEKVWKAPYAYKSLETLLAKIEDPVKLGVEVGAKLFGRETDVALKQHAYASIAKIAYGPEVTGVHGQKFRVGAYTSLKEFLYAPVGSVKAVESIVRWEIPTLTGAGVSTAIGAVTGRPSADPFVQYYESVKEHPGEILGELAMEYLFGKYVVAPAAKKVWSGAKTVARKVVSPLKPTRLFQELKMEAIFHYREWFPAGFKTPKLPWHKEVWKVVPEAEKEVYLFIQRTPASSGAWAASFKKTLAKTTGRAGLLTIQQMEYKIPKVAPSGVKASYFAFMPRIYKAPTKKATTTVTRQRVSTPSLKLIEKTLPKLTPQVWLPKLPEIQTQKKMEQALAVRPYVAPQYKLKPTVVTRLKIKPFSREDVFPLIRPISATSLVSIPAVSSVQVQRSRVAQSVKSTTKQIQKQLQAQELAKPYRQEFKFPKPKSRKRKDLFGAWFKREHPIKLPKQMLRTYMSSKMPKIGGQKS